MSERASRTLPIPIQTEGSWPLFQARFPMPESEWQQMLGFLEAMKPGLVIADEVAPDAQPSSPGPTHTEQESE